MLVVCLIRSIDNANASLNDTFGLHPLDASPAGN
jgi:hypothetical protein